MTKSSFRKRLWLADSSEVASTISTSYFPGGIGSKVFDFKFRRFVEKRTVFPPLWSMGLLPSFGGHARSGCTRAGPRALSHPKWGLAFVQRTCKTPNEDR